MCKQQDLSLPGSSVVSCESKIDIGSEDKKKVDKFCYLGDMLAAEGGADAAVVARVRSGWFKFKQLTPFPFG